MRVAGHLGGRLRPARWPLGGAEPARGSPLWSLYLGGGLHPGRRPRWGQRAVETELAAGVGVGRHSGAAPAPPPPGGESGRQSPGTVRHALTPASAGSIRKSMFY